MHTAKIEKGTRILFANFPADGHFNPLTGLAMYLKSLGCDVRWYTSVKYQHKVQRMNISFYPMKKAFDFAANPDIDAVFPERKGHKSQIAKLKFDMIHVFTLRSPEYFEDIRDIHNTFPFDIMIADITFGGIPFVKEKLGIPVVGVSIIPLPETSRDLPPAGLGLTPVQGFMGRMKQHLLRYFADRILFAHPTRVMGQMLAAHGISTQGSNIFDILIRKSTLVLQSGSPGFEYQRSDMSRHVHFVGPLLPHQPSRTARPWFDERLRSFRKVILITQGTVETDIDKLLVPTLDAFSDTEYLVVVTTGGARTEELRNRFPQHNIIIEDFIAFDEIMPYADVYVTNGGYGGVLLSIRHQLPMVVAGVHEGKNEINARIGYFGLGINLGKETPTSSELKKAILQVIHEPQYLERVKKLSDEFSQYDTMKLCEKHIASLLPRKVVMEKAYDQAIY